MLYPVDLKEGSTEIPLRQPGKDAVFGNEFIIHADGTSNDSYHIEAQNAQDNIAAIYGYRRTHLLATSYAHRVYQVFLPWGVLKDCLANELAYIVLPIFTLVREPDNAYFRRTVSLTLTLLPVDESTYKARPIKNITVEEQEYWEEQRVLSSAHEADLFTHKSGERARYIPDANSPLWRYLRRWHKAPACQGTTIENLARDLLGGLARNCLLKTNEWGRFRDYLEDITKVAVRVSRSFGFCTFLDVPSADLAKWQENPQNQCSVDNALRHYIEKVLVSFPQAHSKDIYKPPEELRLQFGRGIEESHPTLYLPWERLIVEILGNDVPYFQSCHSWTAGWQKMLTTSISAMLEAVMNFTRYF